MINEYPIFIISYNRAKNHITAKELARYNVYHYMVVHKEQLEDYKKYQTEEYKGNVNPIGIRSCYDEGKRCAESLCFDYNRCFGVNIGVVRIFNTYGEYMDKNDGRVISNFINQAIRDETITIYGNGKQTRSFCYISDMISALYKMGFCDEKGPINLGNPSEFNMIELASIVLDKTKSKSKIEFLELPKDDPTKRKPDISKAIRVLSWQPKIGLSEGIDKTILYYKKGLEK